MPEDYQTIFDSLGVDTNSTEGNQDPNPVKNTDPVSVNDRTIVNPQTGTDGDDGNKGDDGQPKQPETPPAIDPEDQRRNEAFAAMRAENNKYKKFLQHIMKGANFTGAEDEFINQLTEASYQRQAQRQGNQISPEILKRMDTLETQNRSLIESQNRQMFATNLRNLQEQLKLNDNEIKEFIDLAVKEKIDLTIPDTNFVTLYQGLFFDKLKEKILNEERQNWIAQNSKANSAANPDGKSGKKDPTPTNVNTMAEFDSLLQSIPKK